MQYSFLTTWLLRSPREPVFAAIHDQAAWPEWWPAVEVAEELRAGDELGVGTVSRLLWRGPLPYGVEFRVTATRIERPSLMEGEATGDLEGFGRWRLFEGDGVTAVVYEWRVETTKPWMNRLAPLLRPAFAWNHDRVMRQGGEGLARRLGCELLALD